MRIGASPTRSPDATLAVVVTEPPATDLASLVETGEVTTKRGTVRAVQLDGQRALVVGGGPLDEVDADVLRDAAAAIVGELRESTGGSIAWPLDEAMPLPLPEQASAIVEGAVLGEYEPGAWKTVAREGVEVSELVLVTDADVSDDVGRAETAALWANRARDLVNRPANDLTPASFADYAAELGRGRRGAQRRVAWPR